MSVLSWIENRSRGLRSKPYGDTDKVFHNLYSRICSQEESVSTSGGIYNLEFSPNGSVLVAACEKKNVRLYDTIRCKQWATIQHAHMDCVNCVKFLDDRIFATCSDDCSVCLWDLRNLKTRVRQLSGHKSWVKNIEYSKRDNLIVTSGLEGSIYTWDVNGGDETRYQKVFHTPGLMRCRISGDDSKMVICTTGGYLIIVHDLNLTTLAADLKGFRPNIHRLMQMGDQYYPIISEFKHVFDRRRGRNRIELISDFPEGNDAEVICSLAIHPHNWCAISRNINADERSEWTCVHDIQEIKEPYQHQSLSSSPGRSKRRLSEDVEEQEDEYDQMMRRVGVQILELRQVVMDKYKQVPTDSPDILQTAKSCLKRIERCITLLGNAPSDESEANPSPLRPSTSFDLWSTERRLYNDSNHSRMFPARSGLINVRVSEDSECEDLFANANELYNASSSEEEDTVDGDSEEEEEETLIHMMVDRVVEQTNDRGNSPAPSSDRFYANVSTKLTGMLDKVRTAQQKMNNKYKTNSKRLLYYAPELDSGKGFIKELCFSYDGRVIASPYDNGVRILAFNEKCQELCDTVESWTGPQTPKTLKEVVVDKNCHSDVVVCAKFSPNYPLLVTGCLRGSIVWHYPKL